MKATLEKGYGYKGRAEEVKQNKVEQSLENVINKYKIILKRLPHGKELKPYINKFNEILTPEEISKAVKLIVNENHDVESEYTTNAELLNQLIQNSYNHGYNDFKVKLKNEGNRLDGLGFNLSGHRDPLKLTVDVDSLKAVGNKCWHVDMKIKGYIHEAGWRSSHSHYKLLGVIQHIGEESHNTTLDIVKARTYRIADNSKDARVIVHEKTLFDTLSQKWTHEAPHNVSLYLKENGKTVETWYESDLK